MKGEAKMQASSLTEEMRKEILSRLKKIEGQARGIRGMVEKDGNCTDILVQISALSSAARRLGMVIMEGCMHDCASSIPSMRDEADVKEKVDDMAKAIYRFINMKGGSSSVRLALLRRRCVPNHSGCSDAPSLCQTVHFPPGLSGGYNFSDNSFFNCSAEMKWIPCIPKKTATSTCVFTSSIKRIFWGSTEAHSMALWKISTAGFLNPTS